MRKTINIISLIFTLVFLISASSASVFIYSSLKELPNIEFAPMENKLKSVILDENKQVIEVFGESKNEYVKYEEIPPILKPFYYK